MADRENEDPNRRTGSRSNRRKSKALFSPFYFVSPLKRETKIAADGILIFYFYFSKKIRLDFSCDSLETSSLIFSKNRRKIFMNVVCCSRDWRFKG